MVHNFTMVHWVLFMWFTVWFTVLSTLKCIVGHLSLRTFAFFKGYDTLLYCRNSPTMMDYGLTHSHNDVTKDDRLKWDEGHTGQRAFHSQKNLMCGSVLFFDVRRGATSRQQATGSRPQCNCVG
jgi:hypothetical protein